MIAILHLMFLSYYSFYQVEVELNRDCLEETASF